MVDDREDPAAHAGAHRVDVTVLAGKDDIELDSGAARERQARHILRLCAVSLPVALVLAEHAFGTGRRK